MRDLEAYYGVRLKKKMSAARMISRSDRYKAKQTAEKLLREVNGLFVRGLYDQCYSLLEQVVCLTPNDHRPFYLLGLIHEEQQNYEKAQMGYFICAVLKRSDTAMWRKVLSLSSATSDNKGQAIALEKIYRREPSEDVLVRKLKCFQQLNKKYWVICSEIEMFDYRGVDNGIFSKFEHTQHFVTMKRICKRLVKCVDANRDAQTEFFVRNTIMSLYKVRNWVEIIRMLRLYYPVREEEFIPEIRIIAYIARWLVREEKHAGEEQRGDGSSSQRDVQQEVLNEGDSVETGPEHLASNKDYSAAFGDLERYIRLGEEDDLHSVGGYGRDGSKGHTEEESQEGSNDRGNHHGKLKKRGGKKRVPDGAPGDALYQIDIESISPGNINDIIYEDTIWDGIKEFKYMDDLADLLKKHGNTAAAIEVLKRITERTGEVSTKIRIAEFYQHDGNIEEALRYYNSVLDDRPTDIRTRAVLYDIYTKLGREDLAEKYETSNLAFRHMHQFDAETKRNYRYTSEKCLRIRELYNRANSALSTSIAEYTSYAQPLLDDFFSNVFVTVKDPRFKSFLNKYEVVEREHAILPYKEDLSKRKIAAKLIRMSSLHGLDVDEWFLVIKNMIMAQVAMGKYREVLDLIRASNSAYVLRDAKFQLPVCFIGLKLGLMLKDFDVIIEISRQLIKCVDYSASYLLYFLCREFPGFYLNVHFGHFQRLVQRASRRAYVDSRTAENRPILSEAVAGASSATLPSSRMTWDGPEDAGESRVDIGISCLPFLILNSYMPRHLFTETVDELAEFGTYEREDVRLLTGIVHVVHTKCRVLINKAKYARTGIGMVRSISDDAPSKKYNLAKAYHFYSYYSQAQELYIQAMESCDPGIRAMAIYNLSLIFKKNKSKAILLHLLSK